MFVLDVSRGKGGTAGVCDDRRSGCERDGWLWEDGRSLGPLS